MNEKQNLLKFGKRLKEIRLKKKLTQAELAEKIELSTNFVGMVERGLRNTSIEKLFSIAKALSLSFKAASSLTKLSSMFLIFS